MLSQKLKIMSVNKPEEAVIPNHRDGVLMLSHKADCIDGGVVECVVVKAINHLIFIAAYHTAKLKSVIEPSSRPTKKLDSDFWQTDFTMYPDLHYLRIWDFVLI